MEEHPFYTECRRVLGLPDEPRFDDWEWFAFVTLPMNQLWEALLFIRSHIARLGSYAPALKRKDAEALLKFLEEFAQQINWLQQDIQEMISKRVEMNTVLRRQIEPVDISEPKPPGDINPPIGNKGTSQEEVRGR